MSKKWNLTIFFFISFFAIVVRFIGYDMVTEDMELAFLPWFKTMKEGGGLYSLSRQIGDYSLLYQTIIALLTYIDASPIYLFKTLSVIFDFLIAFSSAYFVSNYCKDESVHDNTIGESKLFCLTYSCVLFLPTIVMNSGFWGQCDSIYTFFLLWSVWFLYKNRINYSFFMLGLALAFKFQTILLFPLFIYYYFSQKRYSLLSPLITLCTFWFSGIVVYFYRQKIFDSVDVYSNQVVMFKRLWINVPSFWALTKASYHDFFWFAIFLTISLLCVFFLMFVTGTIKMKSFEEIIQVAVLIEWTCIIFLPAMHERYTYVLDLLLLLLAIINNKFIMYAFIAVIASCISYSNYLFADKGINFLMVIVYVTAWLHYIHTLHIFGKMKTMNIRIRR